MALSRDAQGDDRRDAEAIYQTGARELPAPLTALSNRLYSKAILFGLGAAGAAKSGRCKAGAAP